jgi:hypothetical protein
MNQVIVNNKLKVNSECIKKQMNSEIKLLKQWAKVYKKIQLIKINYCFNPYFVKYFL